MRKLGYEFFVQETSYVAKQLLGKIMVYDSPQGKISGIIVEDEAYLGYNDPGSHSSRGKTKRNAVMFGPAGVSYIYQIYGIHFCYNVTTDAKEVPAAVLIRALQPLEGIDIMKKNRGKNNLNELCNGPAKLVQAMGIDVSLNGTSALEGPVNFYESDILGDFSIVNTTRVGISQGADSLLRYYIKDNIYISKK
ncbi:MAG: DNA-3-methyladenine glycosylase [Bacillota bacterium]|jgi:DNA-3-methyladenine glycosylase